MKKFGKCLLITLAVMIIALSSTVLTSRVYNIIFNILCLGKVTKYQAMMYARIAQSVSMFVQIGFVVWLSFLFNKTGLVSYEKQGFGTKSNTGTTSSTGTTDTTGKRLKKASLSLLAGAVCGILVNIIAAAVLTSGSTNLTKNPISSRIAIFMLLGLLEYIGVGFWEELLYRGIIFGYCSANGKKITGVVLSTLSFVLIHFVTGVYSEWNEAFFLLATGLVYALMMLCWNNLWLCVGCHAFYDWAVTYLIEMRLLNSKESFFSLIGVIKKWDRTASLVAGCAVVAVLLIAIRLIGRHLAAKKSP